MLILRASPWFMKHILIMHFWIQLPSYWITGILSWLMAKSFWLIGLSHRESNWGDIRGQHWLVTQHKSCPGFYMLLGYYLFWYFCQSKNMFCSLPHSSESYVPHLYVKNKTIPPSHTNVKNTNNKTNKSM